MPKSYSGDLTPSGQTVELTLQDLPGFGEVGVGSVIAPFAFARVDNTSGTGTAISYGSWNAGTGEMTFTFSTAQPDTDYTVVTDSEYQDDGRFIQVNNKTVNDFTVSIYDTTGVSTPSSINAFGILVYGSDPVIDVSAGDDVILKSSHVKYVPTATQTMSPSVWTDIDGSDISFTPLSPASDILYRYEFPADSANTGEFDLMLRLMVDGVEQTDSFEYNYATHSHGGQKIDYSHYIASWGVGTTYTVKLQGKVREAHRSAIIHPEMPVEQSPASFRQARLTITEYN